MSAIELSIDDIPAASYDRVLCELVCEFNARYGEFLDGYDSYEHSVIALTRDYAYPLHGLTNGIDLATGANLKIDPEFLARVREEVTEDYYIYIDRNAELAG